jgi:hypothetical protein
VLADAFDLQVLEDAELVDVDGLYDNLVGLRPSALVHLAFAAPAQDVDERVGCAVQRALERLRAPLLFVCVDVPRALLALPGAGACQAGWLKPDRMLVHERFAHHVLVLERVNDLQHALVWQYAVGPADGAPPPTGADMEVHQAVAAFVLASIVDKVAPSAPSPRISAAYLQDFWAVLGPYQAARDAGVQTQRLFCLPTVCGAAAWRWPSTIFARVCSLPSLSARG